MSSIRQRTTITWNSESSWLKPKTEDIVDSNDRAESNYNEETDTRILLIESIPSIQEKWFCYWCNDDKYPFSGHAVMINS